MGSTRSPALFPGGWESEETRACAVLPDKVQDRPHLEEALAYKANVDSALAGASAQRVPRTAGAGNGQGRKSEWRNGPGDTMERQL